MWSSPFTYACSLPSPLLIKFLLTLLFMPSFYPFCSCLWSSSFDFAYIVQLVLVVFKCSWLSNHAHVFFPLLIWFMPLLSTNCICASTFLIMFECSSIVLQVFAFLSLVTTILVNPFVDYVYVFNYFLPLMFFLF